MASAWPAVTVWPSVTDTEVTTPEEEKVSVSSAAGASVPVADTACRIVPVAMVSVVVVVVAAAADELPLLTAKYEPTPAPTRTSATITAVHRGWLRTEPDARWNALDPVAGRLTSLRVGHGCHHVHPDRRGAAKGQSLPTSVSSSDHCRT